MEMMGICVKKIDTSLRSESAQSTSEYAIITGTIAVSLVTAAAIGGKSVVQLVAIWIKKALDCALIRVAGPGDLVSAAKELWRY